MFCDNILNVKTNIKSKPLCSIHFKQRYKVIQFSNVGPSFLIHITCVCHECPTQDTTKLTMLETLRKGEFSYQIGSKLICFADEFCLKMYFWLQEHTGVKKKEIVL